MAADDDLDVPPSPWRSLRRLVVGGRRWWVVGAAAVAITSIAVILIVVMSGSSPASAARDDSATNHVVMSTPAPKGPPPGEAAPAPKPVAHVNAAEGDGAATATAGSAAADPAGDSGAPPGDNGAAPVVGSGPCKIAISTTPAGSIITVDGEQAGPSPITVAGPCAQRKVDIVHPRYQTVTRMVTPNPGNVEALDVALPRPTHDLFIESQPAGATVSLDGHRAGTTPTMVKIMGFTTLTLTIEKPGFTAQTKKLYSKTPHDRTAFKLGRVNNGFFGPTVKPL